MAKCCSSLDFALSDKIVPMLDYIVEQTGKYSNLQSTVQERCRDEFSKIMAVNFVYQSNKAERVGTQTFEGTRELLDEYLADHQKDDSTLSETDRESVNNWRALRQSFYGPAGESSSDWKEFRESGLLSIQVVCDLHRILLNGLKKEEDGGLIRNPESANRGKVVTEYQGEVHIYPHSPNLENVFFSIVDRHNIHIEARKIQENDRDKIIYIFKCAAWLLHEVVSLHPFYDGNGRICRLLANCVLSLITPFPVTIYHADIPGRNRDVYIKAIIHCREDLTKGLGQLASMLIEGAYIGWKELFQYLESGGLIGKKNVGPIVIQKSKKANIPNIVKRLCAMQTSLDSKKLEKAVLQAVESADTSKIVRLDLGQYLEIELPIDHDMCVLIHIYP